MFSGLRRLRDGVKMPDSAKAPVVQQVDGDSRVADGAGEGVLRHRFERTTAREVRPIPHSGRLVWLHDSDDCAEIGLGKDEEFAGPPRRSRPPRPAAMNAEPGPAAGGRCPR